MAAQKYASFKALSADQLSDELLSLKKEAFNLRFQAATGQLEKPHRVDEVKKSIARVKTLMRQQQPAAQGK